MDGLEAFFKEAAHVFVVSYGECHRGFRDLVIVCAREAAYDEAPVVLGMLPKLFSGLLGRRAAVAGKGDTFVLLERMPSSVRPCLRTW